jgi:hypothetical protein
LRKDARYHSPQVPTTLFLYGTSQMLDYQDFVKFT